ncbi:MAG: SurA N-terminal domain-containing protein [Desulfocapsa sp.]|nr:SurA N-terminal domain-containing protein [Desulfocapsa sp.]
MNFKTHIICTTALLTTLLFIGADSSQAFKNMGQQAKPTSGSPAKSMGNVKVMEHEAERDAAVAKVNGVPITMGALMDSIMEVITVNYGSAEVTETIARQIRKEALEKLVLEELACQRATAIGIKVDPAIIKNRIEAQRVAAGGEEAFQKMLADQNKSVSYLERQIERYFLVKELINREVNSKLTVSEDSVNSIYEANREQFSDPEVVIITDILFFLDPEQPASEAKVLETKDKIIKELSGDPNLLQEQGILVRPSLSVSPGFKPELYEHARKMEQGALSEPLNLDGTLHLIKLDRYSPRVEQPAEQAKAFIKSRLNSTQKGEILAQWRQELLASGDVEILSEMLR